MLFAGAMDKDYFNIYTLIVEHSEQVRWIGTEKKHRITQGLNLANHSMKIYIRTDLVLYISTLRHRRIYEFMLEFVAYL